MLPPQPPPDMNETNWIFQVNESVRRMPSNSAEERYWEKRSIYRVPACITKHNSNAYWPQAVSFGPYHHGKDDLLPMEEHKYRALLHFLRRSTKQVEPFLDSLRVVAQDLKDSYDMLDPKWKESGSEVDAGKFLKLMLIDGCFMLEILRTFADRRNYYPPNDPIFGNLKFPSALPYIQRDMLMLENQLPMQVLERLVAVESDGVMGHEFINGLILNFYGASTQMVTMGKKLHVLDVVRESLLRHEKMPEGVHPPPHHDIWGARDESIFPLATELHEAGIRFKKSESHCLKDISFANGVLTLPAITVGDSTESMFLNLMTFERSHFGAGSEVTAYMIFMDTIIDSEKDVALLRTQGIIKNQFGSNKAITELFNSITEDMMLLLHESDESVQKKISEHCRKPWNMYRANLIHTYFRNPWSILSLIAAIVLFTLTIIQTIYSVLSCHT